MYFLVPNRRRRRSHRTCRRLRYELIGIEGLENRNLLVCTIPPANLVSWWPGDGNANDIEGANLGILRNGANFAPGEVGQAFQLDGVDDFVSVENQATLNPRNQITLDAWVTLKLTGAGDIICNDGEYANRQHLLTDMRGTGRFRAHVGVPVGFVSGDNTSTFRLNQWYPPTACARTAR